MTPEQRDDVLVDLDKTDWLATKFAREAWVDVTLAKILQCLLPRGKDGRLPPIDSLLPKYLKKSKAKAATPTSRAEAIRKIKEAAESKRLKK